MEMAVPVLAVTVLLLPPVDVAVPVLAVTVLLLPPVEVAVAAVTVLLLPPVDVAVAAVTVLLARLLPSAACQRLRSVGSSSLKTVHLTSTAFQTIHSKLFADLKSNNVQFQNKSELFIKQGFENPSRGE